MKQGDIILQFLFTYVTSEVIPELEFTIRIYYSYYQVFRLIYLNLNLDRSRNISQFIR